MKALDLMPLIDKVDTFKHYGRVKRVVGLMIESQGPESSIGDVCYIHTGINKRKKTILAEVVGFRDEMVILMPFTAVNDISPGSIVEGTRRTLEIKVGRDLIGKAVDPLGQPIDQSILPKGMATVPVDQDPPNPMERPPISEPIDVGVRMIDSLLTVGRGQRVGIFAGSGVEKVHY